MNVIISLRKEHLNKMGRMYLPRLLGHVVVSFILLSAAILVVEQCQSMLTWSMMVPLLAQ